MWRRGRWNDAKGSWVQCASFSFGESSPRTAGRGQGEGFVVNSILLQHKERPMNSLIDNIFHWVLPVLLPVSVLAAVAYYLISRPLRREERTRFLLEMIESALEQGQPIEHYIVS